VKSFLLLLLPSLLLAQAKISPPGQDSKMTSPGSNSGMSPPGSNTGMSPNANDARAITPQPNQARTNPENERLAQRVRTFLLNDPDIGPSAQAVEVTTSEGVVTLTGSVPSAADRMEIQRKLSMLVGSDNIIDRTQVRP
jgi:osmotically-inducible protein OsmY